MASQNSTQEPSMLRGHADYANGAVQETIGSISGSDAWIKSGQDLKSSGIDQMRAANSGTDSKSGFLGEETLGKAVGCEGMAANGQDSNKNI